MLLGPCFPPEITDSIVDLLRDEPGTLEQCCLVSKSWVPRARKHLFSRIEFKLPADVDAWKEIFPDPANSPGYYTHSLYIGCVEVFTITDTEEGGWIRAFSNVVRLRVADSDHAAVSPSQVLALICSLPVLEDLDIRPLMPGFSDTEGAISRPPTSPPLTGTLSLALTTDDEMVECTARRLIDLPIRFRRLEYDWWGEESLPWIMALMEACSDTLESLYVSDETSYYSWEALIDLSKAAKLKDVTLQFQSLSVGWVTSTLKTITSEHRDLQEISIKGRALSDSTSWPANAAAVQYYIWEQWADLEHTLIQIWELHAIRTKVEYYSMKREESREFMRGLLPEATKRGIVELVDISTVY